MIVYAIYIITDDGRTLISEHFQSSEEISNEIILGGMITALQHMTTEMTRGDSELRTIEIEGLSYHIRSFGLIRIVLVTDVPKIPEEIIQILGLRFMNEYAEILMDWDSNLNTFIPFKSTINEILQMETVTDESKSIKPTKKLGTGEIFSLPHHLQSTALALVSIEEGCIEDIAKECGEDVIDIKRNLTVLQKEGFIGRKEKEGKTYYFCSI
ncbi:MAG: hypothetical protein ACXAC8_09495 [Candidatus Hodarchaeales archaeon]|jgi:hypothetical protein